MPSGIPKALFVSGQTVNPDQLQSGSSALDPDGGFCGSCPDPDPAGSENSGSGASLLILIESSVKTS